jgi:hypothetical protein
LRTDLAAASSRILQSYEKPAGMGQVRVPVPAGKIAG